jgi:hypothetical protein
MVPRGPCVGRDGVAARRSAQQSEYAGPQLAQAGLRSRLCHLSVLKTSFSFQRLMLRPIENSLLPDDVGPRQRRADSSGGG